MSIDRTRRALGAALAAAPFAGLVRADDYPSRPIRIVVAFARRAESRLSCYIKVAEEMGGLVVRLPERQF